MMAIRLLYVFFFAIALTSAWVVEETNVEVIPNPYDNNKACHPKLDSLLDFSRLMTKPVATQTDTFVGLSHAKVLSTSVPIYRMKQPARISSTEFEFQLILAGDLTRAGKLQITEVPVPMERARDSWFPGHYWTPIVMSCKDESTHVGWKFTSNEDEESFFYALMVTVHEREQNDIIRVGGLKAPGWMAAAISA